MSVEKPPARDLSYENIENGYLRLRTKPSARMAYSFIPSATTHPRRPEPLLVFLSGVDNAKHVWQRTLNKMFEFACAISIELPPMLFYDRFGTGQSDPDPTDAGKQPEDYHDANDAVADLYQLILQVVQDKYHQKGASPHVLPPIVFCAHSFGVCLARIFSATYPGVVEGLMILDSAIATIPAEKFFPNPDDPASWKSRKDGTSVWSRNGFPADGFSEDICRDAIQKIRSSPISGYAMASNERIRWDNMPRLLPYNDKPKLQGPTPSLPLVTVINNDPDVVGPNLARTLKIPEPLIRYACLPIFRDYASKLHHIQPKGEGKTIIAHGAGHMIHVDCPELVARELIELIANSSQIVEKSRI
ncbi:uncharacterized protein PV09_09190 [Verruconis gallopava]|uniref:AB hydrolase-1 domain-containing protein n=1 Tax=Verruconis gallopava TaxID=253628 RepID=A0A0D1YEF5_9PEZI|nr:uncharacterized protein PV09_09190 [Verruconis gallopava]KIV99086.1 hypothetical protein PV09_09190 [Verruconis gallopava]